MIYVVQRGDTVFSIAAAYGVSAARIRYDNQLDEASSLTVGQALLILPADVIHTVEPGQSLRTIAELYGVTVRKLLRNNPFLIHQEYLIAGETIVIHYVEQEEHPMKVTGYAYPYIQPYILEEVLLYIDELLVFSYGFTAEGELLAPFQDETWMLKEAWDNGVTPILVLTPFSEAGVFNNQLVKIVSTDSEVQQTLIMNLLNQVQEKGYGGVDVDFEYILPEDREGYADFVRNVRETLGANGYQVSVALAPKTSSDQPGLLYEGMDYRLLGEAADYAFLMTYEWGYTYSAPMAVAPINKVRQVLDYAITEIPAYKIMMGVPNYGYDWPLPYVKGTTKAVLIGNVEATRIAVANEAAIQFDEIAKSPYFTYEADGIGHEVWFEDARSIMEKIRTATQYGFLGFGYWNLMRPFRANWLLVNLLV